MIFDAHSKWIEGSHTSAITSTIVIEVHGPRRSNIESTIQFHNKNLVGEIHELF